MVAKPLRVMVVDDQALLRQSLALVIAHAPDMEVAAEAADGPTAVRLAREKRPDVLLLDIRLPGLDGLTVARHLGADPTLASMKIIMLSVFDLDEYVRAALEAGASGFVLKDTAPDALLTIIRRVHSGEAHFAPQIMSRFITEYLAARPTRRSELPALTPREVEILTLVGRGLANDEIATQLSISVKTVKTHIAHVLRKLPARDRVQLVIAAYDAGLVAPRSDA